MRARLALAATIGALVIVPASARQQATAPAASTTPAAAAATVDETALNFGTDQNRMTVPVSIGERGPWRFIIDTGAERTVVSRELATHLRLAEGPPLRVIAMAGPSASPSVIVPALSVSALSGTAITAPALEAHNIGASGLLGIDALQGHSVEIDFDRSAMTVRPARHRRVIAGNHGDEVVVVAKSMFGQLIVTDAHWRNKRIAVVIDTGSTMTVGNPALLAMIGRHAHPLGTIDALSVTGAVLHTQAFEVDDISIGGIGFANVPIAIADAPPFHRFGLHQRPALMLGMDTLRLFRHVRIDFANRDVAFTLPRTEGVRVPG